MIKKIIVTGGCGFIGSHFIDLAIKNKLKVINIDNLSTGSNKKNIKKQYNFYKFFNIDINNYNKLNNIFLNTTLMQLLILLQKRMLIDQFQIQKNLLKQI